VKRKTKIIVTAMSSRCVVGIAAAAGSIFHLWSPSGWPQRIPAEAFTTTKPKPEDVAGTYSLAGKQCRLVLHADGSFQVTNYPTWSASTIGRWQFVSPGITYPDGNTAQQFWGIQLTAVDGRTDTLELTGKASPYRLVKLAADADEGALMTFDKEK
jgi:hypothetical protein